MGNKLLVALAHKTNNKTKENIGIFLQIRNSAGEPYVSEVLGQSYFQLQHGHCGPQLL
jgi:hypothetical protein